MTESPWGDQPPPSDAAAVLRRIVQVGRDAADKKKGVVAAVRAAGHEKTREELRSQFEAESARHGVALDPIWIERQLDELEWSPAERVRHKAHGLLLAGGTLARLAQSRGIPEAPQWMRPPDDASYNVSAPHCEKTAVDVDAGAAGWLDRALANAPGRVGDLVAILDVWFDWDAEVDGEARVAVHLGSEKVGGLDRQASERLVPAMQAASEQGAKPQASAQLAKAAHLQPPYLLVVDIPRPDAA
jgi:hypothetical protein